MLIPVITLLVGLYTGFYFGYLKREGKPPTMPIITEIKALKEHMDKLHQYIENRLDDVNIKPKDEEKEPLSWFDQ